VGKEILPEGLGEDNSVGGKAQKKRGEWRKERKWEKFCIEEKAVTSRENGEHDAMRFNGLV